MGAIEEDVHVIVERLAEECRKVGLNAIVLCPTRVRVSAPGAHERLTETVTCMPTPNGDSALKWWWSWGDPICAADDIPHAVRFIAHVVSPR